MLLLFRPQGATPPQKELIEQAAQILAQENVELCCAFIQKNAVEKAIPEMDKCLATVSTALPYALLDQRCVDVFYQGSGVKIKLSTIVHPSKKIIRLLSNRGMCMTACAW